MSRTTLPPKSTPLSVPLPPSEPHPTVLPSPYDNSTEPAIPSEIDLEIRSLEMVPTRKNKARIITLFTFLLFLAIGILAFVPWQQSVVGYGQVSVYDAMSRPQTIEAQISGRLERWYVQEGQKVQAGQVLADIVDIDSKFLDPERVKNIERQIAAQKQRQAEEQQRATVIQNQIAELQQSRNAQIPSAAQRIAQASTREKIAREALKDAQARLKVAQQVAREAATQRELQAQDRIRQAEQAIIAAEQTNRTEKKQYERIKALYEVKIPGYEETGVRSLRDLELAELSYVRSETEVRRAKDALEVAKRDAKVARLEQTRADVEVDRIRTEVARAMEQIDVAQRDIAVANFDRTRVASDTQANINVAYSNLQAAKATLATIDDTLAKLTNERQNLIQRENQQKVISPRAGTVVRLAKVGAGETVKSGDPLAVLAPKTSDQAVELVINGFDGPLVETGRHVRLQFNGWPALQVSGFPQVAVGTFAGVVSNVDAIDDGNGKFRVWIKPDRQALQNGRDQAWPPPSLLRPGTDTIGWIMLDTVPLGYELWRQFNGFPPSLRREPGMPLIKDKTGGEKADKKDDKKKSGDIKLPKL